MDIARGGRQIVLAPVGPEDGGGVGCQSEDGLQLSLHRALLLGLHIVTDSIVLCLHVVLLAIAEAIDGEVGLQTVATGELIDATHVPAQSFVSHFVVSSARDVRTGLWAVCYLIGIVEASIECQVLVGGIGELLPYDVRTVAREEGGDGPLCLRVRAFHVFQIGGLITVCTIVGERGIGAESVLEDVEADGLRQLSVARHPGVAGHADELLRGLVCDDVDHTSDGIRSIERGGCTVEHLDTLHAGHVDTVQIDIIGDVAREFLAVDQDKDVLVAQSVQAQKGTHRIRGHRHLGHHARQGPVEGGDALFADLSAVQHVDRGGCGFQALVVTRSRHYHRVQIIGATHG